MTEKKFTYILVSTAALAILIVILLNIPWGGDRGTIMREFESLDKDHVYETISYDEVYKKINSGETFQLFIGHGKNADGTPYTDGTSFAYEADKLAKIYNVETIYYLNLPSLNEEQITNLKVTTSHYISFPTLIYFESESDVSSIAYNISSLKELGDFDYNWRSLLTQYFKDCYEN